MASLVRPAQPRPRIKPTPHAAALLLFAVGVALPIYRQGELVAADVAFAFLSVVLVSSVARSRTLRIFWGLALLWWAVQLVSDVSHGTQLYSSLSFVGVSAVLLASGMFWLYERHGLSPAAILAAVGAGWLILEIFAGHAAASGQPWKNGIGESVAVLALSLAYLSRVRAVLVPAALTGLAAVSLWQDCRFFVGVFAFALAGLWLIGRHDRGVGHPRSARARTLAAVLVLAALYFAYPSIARSGFMGDRAQEQQQLYDAEHANYLLATRPEIVQSAYLFAHHPILGLGTNAKISGGEAYEALTFTQAHTQPLNDNAQQYLLFGQINREGFGQVEDLGYQSHSEAVSAAVHAGFLALGFWLFLLVQAARSLVALFRDRRPVSGLVLVMVAWSGWDALFSPITTRTHIPLAITIFLIALTLQRSRRTAATESAGQ